MSRTELGWGPSGAIPLRDGNSLFPSAAKSSANSSVPQRIFSRSATPAPSEKAIASAGHPAVVVEDGIKTVAAEGLCGGALAAEGSVRVAYRLEGCADAPVIVALGGISADRHVVARAHGAPGWWSTLFGSRKAVDTSHFRVLAYDFLGGNGDTHGPRHRADGTSLDVSTADQAEVLAKLLDSLGIERIAAFVGASYGGMVALAFAARYPERVGALCVISAAHKPAPLGTALRTIQRRIIGLAQKHGDTAEGVVLARALAMTTYRTPEEFLARFAVSEDHAVDLDADPAWSYLEARGQDYVRTMEPRAFLNLSRSIDRHRVRPEALATPLTLVSVRSDQCVPLALTAELAARVPSLRQHHVIDSLYGHDAFLKEEKHLTSVLGPLAASWLRGC